jgi:hypothetical protein
MSAIPVWLLDIDGVVNAVTRFKPPRAWPAEDWTDTKAMAERREWRILAATPVVDFIRTVHVEGRAEIRWHTTWQDHAANVSVALGLPEFPVHVAPEFDANGGGELLAAGQRWWKLPGAWRVVKDEDRDLVWTDDDASWQLTNAQRRSLKAAGRVLIMAPESGTGLCKRHLRQIDEFLGGSAVDGD